MRFAPIDFRDIAWCCHTKNRLKKLFARKNFEKQNEMERKLLILEEWITFLSMFAVELTNAMSSGIISICLLKAHLSTCCNISTYNDSNDKTVMGMPKIGRKSKVKSGWKFNSSKLRQYGMRDPHRNPSRVKNEKKKCARADYSMWDTERAILLPHPFSFVCHQIPATIRVR